MVCLHKYIGIPYKPKGTSLKGIDCIGLIEILYKNEFGIILPDHSRISAEDFEGIKQASKHIIEGAKKWINISKPEKYCVILLKVGGYPVHAGLVLDEKYMLHSLKGHDSVIESYTGVKWSSRIEGFYKWQSM